MTCIDDGTKEGAASNWMLTDPKHPESQRIFRAAALLDVLLEGFKSFTRPTGDVEKSVAAGLAAIAELRKMSDSHFGKKKASTVAENLSSLEAKFVRAANAPVGAVQATGRCTRCGGELDDLKGYEKDPFCLKCIDVREPEMSRLDEEFGTWAI